MKKSEWKAAVYQELPQKYYFAITLVEQALWSCTWKSTEDSHISNRCFEIYRTIRVKTNRMTIVQLQFSRVIDMRNPNGCCIYISIVVYKNQQVLDTPIPLLLLYDSSSISERNCCPKWWFFCWRKINLLTNLINSDLPINEENDTDYTKCIARKIL